MVRLEQRPPRRGQKRAPARRRQLDPDAEEADARLEHHVCRDQDGAVRGERRRDVRDQVLADDPQVARAGHRRRLDELAAAEREHLGAHDPRRVEPREDADQNDQTEDALVQDAAEGDVVEVRRRRRREHEQEQEERERHHDVHEPRHDRVDPPAEVARDGAERDPEHEREQRRTERHLERLLAAVEQAEELVPAERAVGAQDQERVRRALGRLRLVDRILLRDGREIVEGGDARPRTRGLVVDVDRVREQVVRPVVQEPRSNRRAREYEQDQREDGDQAREADPVAPEAPPRNRPVTGGRDRRSRLRGRYLRRRLSPHPRGEDSASDTQRLGPAPRAATRSRPRRLRRDRIAA